MNMKQRLIDLVHDDSGQDLIEYALVSALIALGAVASMKTLATTIGSAFTSVGTKLSSAV
ncbi:MAG TPA: Flp family type IVb pilin [Acidisarcina sp.]